MLGFFRKIIAVLNECGIDYMLSGSMAMGVYVLPKSTRDFDFVIHLQAEDASRFAEHFSEGYYCDKDAIADAIKHRSIFNVIDFESGYKADFVILKAEPFRLTEFSRRKEVELLESKIWVVAAEDLFISKLFWVQEHQSAIQMNDLALLCELNNLDWPYIHDWIKSLSLKIFDLPLQ